MAEEPEIHLPQDEPRRCPQCGTRVAAKATTCLMCGTDLTQEVQSETQQDQAGRRPLPGWARALIVVALALAILVALHQAINFVYRRLRGRS